MSYCSDPGTFPDERERMLYRRPWMNPAARDRETLRRLRAECDARRIALFGGGTCAGRIEPSKRGGGSCET